MFQDRVALKQGTNYKSVLGSKSSTGDILACHSDFSELREASTN